MDLITMYKENFTIFIGIFVALAVMGITTLYDKHKSTGGASFSLNEFKFFSDMSPKITATGSEVLKQFSEFGKKLSSLIQTKSGSPQKKPGSSQTKSTSVKSNSSKNFPGQVESVLLKAKNACQKHFAGFGNKISSISSALHRKNSNAKEKFVPLSDDRNASLKFDGTDKVNNLDKAVESKKDELDFDDDLLTKMSTSGNLAASSPELKPKEPSLGEISSGLDVAFDNNFTIDESEFAIKVDGLDNEPVENGLTFNENNTEIKFGDEKDNLLDSLKKDIIVKKEKRINFMDDMQGENLDLKMMKSDLEGILIDLKKRKQYHKS
ncbi:MAG: hypothetical protein QG610_1786 [Euryarchaeota archaeon]|nr:hypothetical protein [Euryarchaeota archaeon]